VVRAAVAPAPAVTAVDPICGMTVTVTPGTPSAEYDGETFHFCCEGCREAFERQHA
jgi:YHS domain-containing protein